MSQRQGADPEPDQPTADHGGSNKNPGPAVDPTTGRPILLAPQRQHRPMLTAAQDKAVSCPFCEGNEAETPPEVMALRAADSAPDSPGWTVRVVPNKYPASAHHEVIIVGQSHAEQPADIPAEEWADVIGVWQARIRELEARPDVACAFLFKNVGRFAGASIPHCHSQLLGLDRPPPRLDLELAQSRKMDSCPWCDAIEQATARQHVLAAGPQHLCLLPDPPKLPFEMWLLPRRCEDDFLTTDASSLAKVLHDAFRIVRDRLDRPAFNLWLHRLPGERFHWHFELQPRTGQVAGLELGGDMYINSIPTDEAARRLLDPKS
ncbi:MAG: DUF4931 domain-containing protein [Planctomycetota bacterium]|nr:DUF4931 domain-containing protein [Planctomycetota bacterium]